MTKIMLHTNKDHKTIQIIDKQANRKEGDLQKTVNYLNIELPSSMSRLLRIQTMASVVTNK